MCKRSTYRPCSVTQAAYVSLVSRLHPTNVCQSSEAAVIQLFTEARRHKPSVIYIPNVDIWYRTVGDAVISTFVGLLRSLPPTDPVLVLGVLETDAYADQRMIQDLFGFSRRNLYNIVRPGRVSVYIFQFFYNFQIVLLQSG